MKQLTRRTIERIRNAVVIMVAFNSGEYLENATVLTKQHPASF
jgi:hypothetical protein